MAILLLGKRYGSVGQNGNSITHNEFQQARSSYVPVYCLVEQEVLTYKRVFEANAEPRPSFPGMDNPAKTFSLIAEITSAGTNNAILPFTTVADARDTLRKQFALLFGHLLTNLAGTTQSQIKDILSEVKRLRHELVTSKRDETQDYLRVTRLLLDDEFGEYRDLLVALFTDLDIAIPLIIASHTFESLVEQSPCTLEVLSDEALSKPGWRADGFTASGRGPAWWPHECSKPAPRKEWRVKPGSKLALNQVAKDIFAEVHKELRRRAGCLVTSPH